MELRMHRFVLGFGLFLFVNTTNAAIKLTEAKTCHRCDYRAAVQLATSFIDQPECHWKNADGSIKDKNTRITRDSFFECDRLEKDIIIVNPWDKKTFKFHIQTTTLRPMGVGYGVDVDTLPLSKSELKALEEFYKLDSRFKKAVQNATNKINNPPPTKIRSSRQRDNDDTSGVTAQCSNHPSFYLTSYSAQEALHQEFNQLIANELKIEPQEHLKSTTENYPTIDIRYKGGGVSLTLLERTRAYATKVYNRFEDYQNKLVFDVGYYGKIEVGNQRRLGFNFILSRGASQLDGLQIGNFMSGNNKILPKEGVSNCLIKNLESIGSVDILENGVSKDNTKSDSGWYPSIRAEQCVKVIRFKACYKPDGIPSCTDEGLAVDC